MSIISIIVYMDEIYFSTKEVSKKINIKIPTLLLYARKKGIKSKGEARQKRYFWTEKDIETYISYSTDPQKKNRKKIKPTTNYNTLYVRLKRAKEKNNQERIVQYTKELNELLKKRKTLS